MCSERLGDGCEVDVSAEGCDSTNVGDLITEIGSLILSGDCNTAKSCAGAVNEGDALVLGINAGGSAAPEESVERNVSGRTDRTGRTELRESSDRDR